MHPSKDQTYNLGMCPDRDQAQDILVYGTTLQPMEPQKPGLRTVLNQDL